jgi:S-adenosylmethionine:tRNA ribosyltransferase-isomerase
MFSLSDYKYTLPSDLIAQEAIHPHHDARMMVIDKETGNIEAETTFWNITNHLGDDRVLFFNDSRVVRSRIILNNITYTKKNGNTWVLSNGEIFYLSSLTEDTFDALIRPGNKFKIGTIFEIWNHTIEVIWDNESGRILKLIGGNINWFLEKYGSLPLPPYIKYDESKEADYQTSFAKNDWSVAAPTASLHFTQELMDKIQSRKEYITLHVGLWTFKWIQTSDIRDYNIHSEKIEIQLDIFQKIANIKEENKKIVAVGTTATRTLESLPYLWKEMSIDIKNIIDAKTCNYWNRLTETIENQKWIDSISLDTRILSIHFNTSIYITPGYEFRIVDDLITNFHLSESSLLVLVSAFIGHSNTQKIYDYAIWARYRFYSFWDGMYIRWK